MRGYAFEYAGPAGPWGGCGRGGFRAVRPGHGHRHGRGPGAGPWGRPRMRRGDVRSALLVLLDEAPQNGYGLMQEVERRSGGMWKPSPGSVYPALQQLEDEGLVRSTELEGRKQFELTDAGRAHVEEHRDRLGEPWKQAAGTLDDGLVELRDLVFGIGAAVMQVASAGDEAQQT